MGWFDSIIDALKRVVEYFGSDKTRNDIMAIFRLALMIANAVDKFNAPLGPREKDAASRVIMDFFRYISPEDIQTIMETITATDLNRMEAYEIDAILGAAKARVVAEKKGAAIDELPHEIKNY